MVPAYSTVSVKHYRLSLLTTFEISFLDIIVQIIFLKVEILTTSSPLNVHCN